MDSSVAGTTDLTGGWTAVGNAQLDTAEKKFGTASLLLDGTGDYIKRSTIATVGTQDFTIDLQVRRNGANTNNAILTWGGSGADTGLRILTSTDNKLIISTGNSAVIGTGDHSTSLPDGEFAHVALSKRGGKLYLFQAGTLLSSKDISFNLNSTSEWWIGDDVSSSGPNNFNGHIDEVRIIIGEGKFGQHGFTAPSSAYTQAVVGTRGGGGGASGDGSPAAEGIGRDGGSGGGGGWVNSSTQPDGGAGTSNQGFAGGFGSQSAANSGGGGGGAGAVGTNSPNDIGNQTGGAGGGGGAGNLVGSGSATGGGGQGGYAATRAGASGDDNTGGGGGGGQHAQTSGAGGSGVVIVAYKYK